MDLICKAKQLELELQHLNLCKYAKRCKTKTSKMQLSVQSVLFPKDEFTRKQATKWAKDNNYKVMKVDETSNYYRLRQINPKSVKPKSYKTKVLSNGVRLVMAEKMSKNSEHSDEEIKTSKMAEYKGRKVTLNKPFRTPKSSKKFAVYVRDPKTKKVVIVRFGSQDMDIKRDDAKRLKSFRARHKCDTANDITSPRYWSCKMWQKGKTVSEMTKGQKTSKFSVNVRIVKMSKFQKDGIKSDVDLPIPMEVELDILASGKTRDGYIRNEDIEHAAQRFMNLPIIDFHDMKDTVNPTSYKQSDKKGFLGETYAYQDESGRLWVRGKGWITDRYIAYLIYLHEMKGTPLEISAEFKYSPLIQNGEIYQTNINPKLVSIVDKGEIVGNRIKIVDNAVAA